MMKLLQNCRFLEIFMEMLRYNHRHSSSHVFTPNPRWRETRKSFVCLFIIYPLICLALFGPGALCDHDDQGGVKSIIKLVFNDSKTGKLTEESDTYGFFGQGSSTVSKRGLLVQVRTMYNSTNGNSTMGCGAIEPSIVPNRTWIGLVERGICDFNDKIFYVAKQSNASAVVVYNNEKETEVVHHDDVHLIKTKGEHSVENTVAVYIYDYERGQKLVRLLESGVEVTMEIAVSTPTTTPSPNNPPNQNSTSVLFVSISFIVLIIISLAWLVFYYIQRCRYTNAKERLSRRLANAAKKAIAKIPQRTIKLGDKELDADADQCAVCIEPYKTSDVIRVLPCKHVFHKSCVDPWLLDQRSCPMCKMDILRAFGMHLNGSQESVPQDQESGVMPSSPIIDHTEHLSNSEEQGAVGGVKIVLYQHQAVRFGNCDEPDFSSEGSLECAPSTSRTAQCLVECTNEALLEQERLNNQLSLARSLSMESIHSLDSECNERRSLITGLSVQESSGSVPRRKSSSSGSVSHGSHDFEH